MLARFTRTLRSQDTQKPSLLSHHACCVSGPGLLAAEEGQAGLLARACFLQLDADSADEALLNQALKCIVFLALPLYDQDAARDLIPSEQQPSLASPPANGMTRASNGNGLHALTDRLSNAEQANGQHSARPEEESDAEPDGLRRGMDGSGEHAGDQLEQDTDGGDDQDDAGEAADWQVGGQSQEDSRQGSFTLAGLVRRMSSLACDR